MTTVDYVPMPVETIVRDRRGPAQLSVETQCLLSLGKERGWDFTVLGRAPMPLQSVQVGDWLVVPAAQDQSHIPVRAWERLHAIREAGLQPQGFVVVHELPKSLPGAVEPQRRGIRWPSLSPVLRGLLVACGIILAIPVLAAGAAFILAAIATVVTTVLAFLIIPAIIFAGVLGLDPILVAVTKDGYWVEIDRWDV